MESIIVPRYTGFTPSEYIEVMEDAYRSGLITSKTSKFQIRGMDIATYLVLSDVYMIVSYEGTQICSCVFPGKKSKV